MILYRQQLYQSAGHPPKLPESLCIWASGTTSLLDYGVGKIFAQDCRPLICVLSLINKAYI